MYTNISLYEVSECSLDEGSVFPEHSKCAKHFPSKHCHLFPGGKLDRHFLLESCPLFHNLTKAACRDFQVNPKTFVIKVS